MRKFHSSLVHALAVSAFILAGAYAPAAVSARLTGEVPFDLVRNTLVAKVSLKGEPACDMLLDTGADPSMIDLDTARRTGMKLPAEWVQGDGGGTDVNPAYPTVLRDFKVGSISVDHVEAAAIDLSAPSRGLGRQLCGVLGYSLLRGQIFQVDYQHGIARFLDRSPLKTRTTILLPFHYHDDLLVRGLRVNGKPVVANFDTGSNGAFQFAPAAVKRLGLEADFDAATPSESVGFNGKTENRAGKVGSISVGTAQVKEPSVTFYGANTGRDKVHWDIRVGNAFLRQYLVTFDFPDRLILLDAPTDENAAPPPQAER